MVLIRFRIWNRNRNFSEVETGISINHYGSITLLEILEHKIIHILSTLVNQKCCSPNLIDLFIFSRLENDFHTHMEKIVNVQFEIKKKKTFP